MIGRVYGLGDDFHSMVGPGNHSVSGKMMDNYDLDINGFFAAANNMYFQPQTFNQYNHMHQQP